MRLTDSPEEAAWRTQVHEFLERELPDELRRGRWRGSLFGTGLGVGPGGPNDYRYAFARDQSGPFHQWRQKLLERGWIAPAWPKEYGGGGLSVMEQFILNEELAEAQAPQPGVPLVGPTLIVHGTEEQKKEFLPGILRGETTWCQGFSEPGSGSDLASLQTRAVRDGDDYLLNGQKIWTSGARRANWMFMLARTDPDAPKHRGISFFMLDMASPGISVRPLDQINGASEFNEVFFEDVRVPARNIIGEVNRGWYVGTTTLDYERSGIGSAVGTRQTVERIIAWCKANVSEPHSVLGRNRELRLELGERLVEAHVALLFSYRVADLQNRGRIPNYEASMAKLYTTELTQRIARTALKTVGLYGMSVDTSSPRSPAGGQFSRSYMNSVSSTIGGGTSEIQRNIIATRGLGLPRG
jgi:alkylation response protein AidB-like acyl-CoA dehydrogenase